MSSQEQPIIVVISTEAISYVKDKGNCFLTLSSWLTGYEAGLVELINGHGSEIIAHSAPKKQVRKFLLQIKNIAQRGQEFLVLPTSFIVK